MLSERYVDEVLRLLERLTIRDRLRDADHLDRRAGAVVEPDMLADGVGVGPVVPRELLVDDDDARRIRRVRGMDTSTAQNLDAHRREEAFVDDIHRRREVLA